MRFSRIFVAVALAGSSAALNRRDDVDLSVASTKAGLASPKRYIVEFTEGTDHAEAVNELNSRPGLKVVKVFNNTDIFSGVTVLASRDNTDSLQAMQAVARVWPSKKFKLEPTLNTVAFAGGLANGLASPNYTIHSQTGVDKLHNAGILGKGALVVIIDTGIYYPHPDIGGGIGSGYKVAGGYDYVGDGDWPIGEKQPDSDPLDYIGHGTHVAGILAAKSAWFVGVAPEATLLAYKVFTEQGTVDEDTLIQAFTDAYTAGADIITASIAGASGWQDDAWAVVADRLVDAGVVITIAAGNNGELGPFFASSGSSGRNVLAVASVEPVVLPSLAFNVTFNKTGDTARMAYNPPFGPFPHIQDWPIILLDPCSPLPADTPTLVEMIPLIATGICGSYTKEKNLYAFDAQYILMYTPSKPDNGVYVDDWTIQHGYLETVPGQLLAASLEAGNPATATFSLNLEFVSKPNGIAGTPSYFTSYGGTYELALKPDIAAPGSNILSLYLDNSYSFMSGTSMATPYIAGIAALYVGKYGGRSVHGAGFAKQLAARIMSSGEAVLWGNYAPYNETFAPTVQVGNGLVNASKVLSVESELSFAKFQLNDTHHFERYHSVDVTNNGAASVEYTFEVEPAGGFEAYWPNATQPYLTPRMKSYQDVIYHPMTIVPSVKLPSGKFVVKPGETKTAEFIFNIPDDLTGSNLPVFSGRVLVKGSNGEQLAVPYFGVGSNMKHDLRTIWLDSFKYPRSYSTNSRIPLAQKSSFSFNLSLAEQDFPKLLIAQTYGTKELRWDIFDKSWKERDWTYPLVAGQNGYVGSATSWVHSGEVDTFDPSTDDENDLNTFPMESIVRDVQYEFWWFGKLCNGSTITPGKYKMRIATLLPFGDRAPSDNWDVWQTPTIEVVT